MTRASRIGLVASDRMPRWALRCFQTLGETGSDVIWIRVRNVPKRTPLVFRLYKALDRRLFHPVPHAADLVDTCSSLSGFPAVSTTLDNCIATLRTLDLDLIIDPIGILPTFVCSSARRGLWRLDGCDAASAFFQILRLAPFVVLRLLEFAPDGVVRVLLESTCERDRRSLARTQEPLLWKAADLPNRALSHVAKPPEAPVEFKETRQPTTLNIVVGSMWIALRYVGDKLRAQYRPEKWCLGWQMNVAGSDIYETAPMLPPRGIFWADPFPFEYKDRVGLFFEEGDTATERGIIRYMQLNADGTWEPPKTVLEATFSLSYPFVFEYSGNIYMIPETYGANEIRLYRCVSFPLEWVLDRVLMTEVRAVDTTLIEHDGRWWMFTAMAVPGGRPDDLHVFFADSPFGPYMSHRRNPVISGVLHTRPAGRIYREDGFLVRPSQDCSFRYGRAVTLNRIVKLTVDEYEEVEHRRIEPEWHPAVKAIHTINSSQTLRFLDQWVKLNRRETRLSD